MFLFEPLCSRLLDLADLLFKPPGYLQRERLLPLFERALLLTKFQLTGLSGVEQVVLLLRLPPKVLKLGRQRAPDGLLSLGREFLPRGLDPVVEGLLKRLLFGS